MNKLIRYFVKYSIAGNLLMVLILLFGIIGMFKIQTTFFPQAPVRNIMIQTVYPGSSAEEIEESVVLKIEDQLTGVLDVARVTSTSNENAAMINVEIKKGADIDEVLQNVKNAVDQIYSFPVGLETINIYKFEMRSNAITFSISGSKDLRILKQAARRMERDLLAMDGISKIDVSGFPDEEISIEFNEEQLRRYGITMQQVLEKVKSSNVEITGGAIKGEEEEYKIRLKNKAYFGTDIKSMVVLSNPDGRLVRLKDVADVRDKWAEAPDRNYLNGESTATLDVHYTNSEDLLEVTGIVRTAIVDFNKKGGPLKATVIRDYSKVVNDRIDMLRDNGLMGFVLVLILLAMFLHWRLAIWVAMSIPIAFGGMFILANIFGITINVITLFGMITVIGILVDDGVVISENIYRHYEEGKDRMRAAIDGTLEVMPAVFSAILTTIIVFSSFFFVDGRLGDFFSEMAFIVIATLLFSLVEGLFILPAHVGHSRALDREQKPNKIMQSLTSLMDWMKYSMYEPILDYSLKNRLLAVAIPIGLFIITIGAMKGGVIQTTFFPTIEREDIKINLKMPAGVQEQVTLKHLDHLEKSAWKANELYKEELGEDVVVNIDKRVGPGTGNIGSVNVKLTPSEDRKVKQLEIANRIRDLAGEIPGAEELSLGTGNPFGKPVSVALRGEDMGELRLATEILKEKFQNMPDLNDITDNDLEGTKEIILQLKEKAYLLGFSEAGIMRQVRQGFFGGEVQRIQRGLDEVRIWVRYSEASRSTIKHLKEAQITSPTGGKYYLKDLVDFNIKRGVVAINHTDGKREIRVEADLSGKGATAFEIEGFIQESIMPEVLNIFPNLTYEFEGQSKEKNKSMNSMQAVMPIILILMVSVVIITFRSVTQTIVVMFLLIFGFIGVAWGHYVHGMSVSLFSILGTIALIGIMINDSLVLVSAFNQNIKRGQKFTEALKDTAMSRFRPIVLTSITTVAGLAPLILETSFQAQFLIPMALSIAYGLSFATIVILIVLPVLLSLLNQFKRYVHWYWYDNEVSAESVEPAYKELSYEDQVK